MPSRYGIAQSERIRSKVGGGNPPIVDASQIGVEAGFHSAQTTSRGLKRVILNLSQSSLVVFTISASLANPTDLPSVRLPSFCAGFCISPMVLPTKTDRAARPVRLRFEQWSQSH